MSLNKQLSAFKKETDEETPADILEKMAEGSRAVEVSRITASAKQAGEKMEMFTLSTVKGGEVALIDLVKDGPVVINFYRGSWCPYCNMELLALQGHLSEIKNLGAQLIAISPERPDDSLTAVEKSELEFDVLHDPDNTLARKLGLVFEVPENLVPIYKEWDIDIKQSNDAEKHELPLASTFIVNTDGIVKYVFHNADYTVRMEPEAIVEQLKAL